MSLKVNETLTLKVGDLISWVGEEDGFVVYEITSCKSNPDTGLRFVLSKLPFNEGNIKKPEDLLLYKVNLIDLGAERISAHDLVKRINDLQRDLRVIEKQLSKQLDDDDPGMS